MDNRTELPKPGKKGKRRFYRGRVAPRVGIEDQVVKVAVPEGSRSRAMSRSMVQDLVISAKATCYQRERWVTPDGRPRVLAPVAGRDHWPFWPRTLRRFVLMQVHIRDNRRCPGW